jgi:thiamine-phosphate pyrophosphorylase
MKPRLDLSVYLITDPGLCRDRGLVETAVAAVRGGATVVQLRDKSASDRALIQQGLALREALTGTTALLIVNDRVEVAAAVGADGVHVGQSDVAAAEAREALGPDAIIGLSIQRVELAAGLEPELIDYIGVGPVFATATKPDHAHPLGFGGLARICAASPLPAVAIGGLRAGHVASVLGAGACGLAVVSAICGAPDPEAAAREFASSARHARPGATPDLPGAVSR